MLRDPRILEDRFNSNCTEIKKWEVTSILICLTLLQDILKADTKTCLTLGECKCKHFAQHYSLFTMDPITFVTQ